MQFANDFFWLLLLVPCAFLIGSYRERARKKRLANFADTALLPQLIPGIAELSRRGLMRTVISAVVTLFLVLTLLQPQWGFVWREGKSSGVDIAVAIDVSESMLAEDVKPNRLERARREVLDLIESLRGDRVALIAFAGTAFIELPLTLDYATFRLYLDSLDVDFIPIKGSDIELALLKSLEALRVNKKDEKTAAQPRSQAIVLITDGEDQEGDFGRIRALAEGNHVAIYILGIGTPEGAPIPSADGYKRDRDGKIVLSKLHEEDLAQLAVKTGGIYVKSISADLDTQTIYEGGIKKTLEEHELKSGRTKRWNEYFQLPLVGAVLLLLFEPFTWLLRQFRTDKTATAAEGRKFRSVFIGILFALILQPLTAHAESAEAVGDRARESFERGEFAKSLEAFTEGANRAGEDYRMFLGRGASEYRLGQFGEAATSFTTAAGKAKDPKEKSKALYNAGNALTQQEALEDAIKSYEESLKLAPQDEDAKKNLEFVKKLLEEKKKEQKKKNNQKQQQQNQEKQEQQKKEEKQQQQQEQQKESDGKQDQQQSQENKKEEEQKKNEQEKKEDQQSTPDKQEPQQSKESGQQPQNDTQGENSRDKEQPKEDEGKDAQGSAGQGEKEEKEATQGNAGGAEQKNSAAAGDQVESVLGGIEEGKQPLQKYRIRKAINELQSLGKGKPEKDW